MNILITGSNGFLGRNFKNFLNKNYPLYCIYEFNSNDDFSLLLKYIDDCDIIFHFAAKVRPSNYEEYFTNNVKLTGQIVTMLNQKKKSTLLFFSSSIQIKNNNEYGISKLEEENLISKLINIHKTYILRLPNIFGPFSKPNSTNVTATFCYNTIKNLPSTIINPSNSIELYFVNDLVRKCFLIVKKRTPSSIITFKANKIKIFDLYWLLNCIFNNKKTNMFPRNFISKLKLTLNSFKE
jgi:UDP-2-acetamido-2,6-beta-L-arabino-hexul-4-ose reductase